VLARAGWLPEGCSHPPRGGRCARGNGLLGTQDQPDLLAGLTRRRPPPDTDRDGMPDAWEKTHGLDPARDDSAKTMSSGYTAVEEYLNGWRRSLFSASSPVLGCHPPRARAVLWDQERITSRCGAGASDPTSTPSRPGPEEPVAGKSPRAGLRPEEAEALAARYSSSRTSATLMGSWWTADSWFGPEHPAPLASLMSSNHDRETGIAGSFWTLRARLPLYDSVLAGPVTSHKDSSYVPTAPAPPMCASSFYARR